MNKIQQAAEHLKNGNSIYCDIYDPELLGEIMKVAGVWNNTNPYGEIGRYYSISMCVAFYVYSLELINGTSRNLSEFKEDEFTYYLCIDDYVMYSGEIGFKKGKIYRFDSNMNTKSELFGEHDMKGEKDFDAYFSVATNTTEIEVKDAEVVSDKEYVYIVQHNESLMIHGCFKEKSKANNFVSGSNSFCILKVELN